MDSSSFYKILIVAGFAGAVAFYIVHNIDDGYVSFLDDEIPTESVEVRLPEEVGEEANDEAETSDIGEGSSVERELGDGSHELRRELENNNVITYEPLKAVNGVFYPEDPLTVEGIIYYSNKERLEDDLHSLVRSEKLDRAARYKLEDMFEFQYFAHNDPDGGMGADELADMAGYDYILIGENLAMGNFEDDRDLVTAWMDSPGHRSNILRDRYTEIGVAVQKGVYNGRDVWMAVQIFGTPMSECPAPDDQLAEMIRDNKAVLEVLSAEIRTLEAEIDEGEISSLDEYGRIIDQYNSLVESHNELIEETKIIIERLNTQIEIFNECVRG